MSVKKKILISVIAVLSLAVILVVILVPLHFTGVSFSDPKEGIGIPIVSLADIGGTRTVVDKDGNYLAHPDMLLTPDGDLLVTFTQGHGKGPLAMRKSADFGESWSERIENTPESWEKSQETSTLYNLDFVDENGEFTGENAMIMISGCPHWSGTTIKKNGFNCSISQDKGANWSEFENFYGIEWAKGSTKRKAYDAIVAMSSLTQIKENGKFQNKWLGTFHDHDFKNYRTYLTINRSEDGKLSASWTQPELLLGNLRSYEKKYNICEVEIIRTPNADGTALTGDTLILLGRSNTHKAGSVILFSDDEGITWTSPKELPAELTGDRHKAEYDPINKKLMVSFRHINVNGKRFSNLDTTHAITSLGWVGWVGTFDDLLAFRDGAPEHIGEKLIVLSSGYKGGADCGYSGTAYKDGEFVAVSYGTFDEEAENPYILSVKFRV